MTSAYDAALLGPADMEDPRLLRLARGTRLLNVEATVWAKAARTDGFIPSGALRRITDEDDPARAAAELVRVGAWREVEDGWQIVGFTDRQMSRERVERKEQRARVAREAYEERTGRKHKPGETSPETSPERSPDASASQPASLPARKGRKAGGRSGNGSTSPRPNGAARRPADGEGDPILRGLLQRSPEGMEPEALEQWQRYAREYASHLPAEVLAGWLREAIG